MPGSWSRSSKCRPGFTGTAVTRSGRVLFGGTGELRQAPAGGEQRVLEQRNRREELIAATERAAGRRSRPPRQLELARVGRR